MKFVLVIASLATVVSWLEALPGVNAANRERRRIDSVQLEETEVLSTGVDWAAVIKHNATMQEAITNVLLFALFESQPESSPAPPVPTPAPEKPIQPVVALAPVCVIKVPTYVDFPHMVHVELILTGGPIREQEIEIDPPPDGVDIIPGFKEVEIGGEKVKVIDESQFYFTAKPDIYTIKYFCTGRDKGYAKKEARVQIRDTRLPTPAPTTEAVGTNPRATLKKWAAKAPREEKLKVAAAARDVRARFDKGEFPWNEIVEKWQEAVMLKMESTAVKKWNVNENDSGQSFFEYVTDLFVASSKLAKPDYGNLLFDIASTLEGK